MAMLGSINGVLMEGLDGDKTWRLKDYVARGGYAQLRRILKARCPRKRLSARSRNLSCADVAAPAFRRV